MKASYPLILALAVLFSCRSQDPQPVPEPDPVSEVPQPDPVPESKGAYRHVVIIGVDGGGAFFQDTDTPRTDEIFANGARTYTSQAVYPTISAQNWGSMLHCVLPEFHRLTNQIVASRPYPVESPYPSIFRVVREAWPQAPLASFCNWNPINYGIIEDNIGVVEGTGNDLEVAGKVVDYLGREIPTVLFVQFDSVDGAGHGHGYGSPEHLQALTAVDALIGQIYKKFELLGILDETLFIVSADHGGTPGGSHGGDTEAELNVFLGVAGKTVEPGTGIVDSDARDVAAIAAYALGLEFPEMWTGRVPTGVFKGVEATERKVVELPVHESRKHQTVTTPDLSEIQALLSGHDVIAYLPLDGDAKDAFGKVETAANGKLYSYDAYFGKGTAFDDGYILLKDVSVGKGSFSLSCWMKTSGVSGDPAILCNKDWDSGLNDGFVFSLREEDLKFNAGCKSASQRMDLTAALPHDYQEGWMHVALTVDRKANKVHIYEDFALEASTDIPSALKDVSFDALDLVIGQDGRGRYKYSLSAQLDEIILTADVLTGEDIDALKTYYR